MDPPRTTAPSTSGTLSTPLLLVDCALLAAYSLGLSAFKSFALAGSDLLSPGFNLAADIAAFDALSTSRYIAIENFGATCLAAGWLVGGVASGACSDEWRASESTEQSLRIVQGWVLAAPLACALKYGVLSQTALPSLGWSTEAIALEAQLAGLTVQNVASDALGMLAVVLLWRQLLTRNPNIM